MKQVYSIRWQLPLSYAGIAFFAVAILGVMLLTILENHYAEQERDYLRRNAENVERFINMDWSRGIPLDQRLRWLSFLPQTRIELTDPQGEIIANSDAPQVFVISPSNVAPHPPEDTWTISGEVFEFSVMPINPIMPRQNPGDVTVVYSGTYGFELRDPRSADFRFGRERSEEAVSIPVYAPDDQRLLGNITVSGGPAIGRDVLKSVTKGWLLAGSITVILAAGIGWIMSYRISKPLIALTHSTQHLAAGDLTIRSTIQRRDELGSLAQSFNSMAEQIENNFQTLKRFVADAAHEIHTPITALRTNLELAAEQSPSAQNQQALNQVKQLERLTNDLLDLSQIEADTPNPYQSVDLTKLLRSISEVYASRAEQADLDYQLDLPEEPVLMKGCAARMERAISNLLDNAIKFTPPGGVIHVWLSKEGKLHIQDTGIGIPADDLPALFERFKRGRNAASYVGSGLGLAIVKAIIDSHQGSVSAESDSAGTCITMTLPLAT